MYTIRSKNDLINFIASHPKIRPAIRRAVENGGYENLGGFKYPGRQGHWCVRLNGVVQEWFVVVYYNLGHKDFSVRELYTPPEWKYWDGDSSENPLYQGDNPEKYRELKNEQRTDIS